MAIPVEMPKLGNTVEQCLLARWVKRPGEPVAAGETIVEIETDKATFDVPAPVDGTVLAVFFADGDLVPVFANICVIGSPGEDAEPFRPAAQGAAEPGAPQPLPDGRGPVTEPAERQAGEAVLSPRARRFAEAHGMGGPFPAGSGPGGRVLEEDLRRAYFTGPRLSGLAAKLAAEGYEAPREAPGSVVRAADLAAPAARMPAVRERIARRMRESLAGTAQYTLHASADATGLLALRAKFKAAHAAGRSTDININDLVVFCTVKALRRMPELNAELIDGKIRPHSAVHIGFACDTSRGLLVPVVRNCQDLSLEELAARMKALAAQAAEGTIGPDDLAGGTFTVSNLGGLGIERFTPILNPPQVAVLGVDAIALRPVRREDRIEFVDRIGLSLTCDHQVIDGAPGARFLGLLGGLIADVGALVGN